MEVCAVVVTYKRPQIVLRTILAIGQQSDPPCQVIVVDNDGDPDLENLISRATPSVRYLSSPENVGYGAALALGMQFAKAHYDPQCYWLLDDDTPPAPTALASAKEVFASSEGAWVVGNRGGRIIRGQIRHGFPPGNEVNEADFTLVDGALISRKAVDAVGFPREDLFMMFEDIDYTARIADSGGRLFVRSGEETALHLGSGSDWRAYYQSRNHLRVAIERRSPVWVYGWARRTFGLCLRDVEKGRWHTLRLRWCGAMDAVLNRMGSGRHAWLTSHR